MPHSKVRSLPENASCFFDAGTTAAGQRARVFLPNNEFDGQLFAQIGAELGIGVGLAKVLRSMGISTFGQVAAMDEATMSRLDDLVGGIRDRSMRHDWAGAALALQVEGTVAAS